MRICDDSDIEKETEADDIVPGQVLHLPNEVTNTCARYLVVQAPVATVIGETARVVAINDEGHSTGEVLKVWTQRSDSLEAWHKE